MNLGEVSETVTAQSYGATLSTVQGPTNFASPECFVDIYPYEGGPYSISGGQVLRCHVEKDIKAASGTFVVQIAPESLEGNLSWGQIITPMSFVVIGFTRAGISAVSMIGVVTHVEENQTWRSGQATTRIITIQGKDIAYFFTMQDYYTLFFLSAVGNNITTGFGSLAAGRFSGDPGDVASNWYQQIMVGTPPTKTALGSPGVFLNMSVPYKTTGLQNPPSAATLKISDLLGSRFDPYDVKIPFADYFLGVNGAWIDKFNLILPFPFYEFFITTASRNVYAATFAGTSISSSGLDPSITATPQVIGRINPLPSLKSTSANGANNPITFDSIDTSAWEALPTFDLLDLNFIQSSIRFSEESVYNFYNINFPYMTGLLGDTNSNYILPIFNYASAGDKASIDRYGYRPLNMSIQWFSDPAGAFAKSNLNSNIQQVYATLIGRVAGYFEATPLMAEADVKIPLRPDMQIGCKFSYAPYRSGEPWDFYIEGVIQDFTFGGETSTQLRLTRGLPHSVYADSGTGGLLFAIHTGNAQRVGSKYSIGLPANSSTPLQGIPINQMAAWMTEAVRQYTNQQFTGPPAP